MYLRFLIKLNHKKFHFLQTEYTQIQTLNQLEPQVLDCTERSNCCDGEEWQREKTIQNSVCEHSWSFLSKYSYQTSSSNNMRFIKQTLPIWESNQIVNLLCFSLNSLFNDEFYRKIENISPTFKQLSPLQAIGELNDFYKL